MADFTALEARIATLAAQVEKTETTEAGAVALINSQRDETKKAVADALTADNAADQGSIDAANSAIDAVAARFAASAGKLGDAVANVPTPQLPPNPPAGQTSGQ